MAIYYPPVGFHFKVEVQGFSGDSEMRFTEAGGLSMEIATEEMAEGGENRFVQKYPTRAKYPELVLKRGLLVNAEIHTWIKECVDDLIITMHDIDVTLLNESHEPLMTWHLVNAYPTKWGVSDLNAQNNAVVIESLQFYYQYYTLNS